MGSRASEQEVWARRRLRPGLRIALTFLAFTGTLALFPSIWSQVAPPTPEPSGAVPTEGAARPDPVTVQRTGAPREDPHRERCLAALRDAPAGSLLGSVADLERNLRVTRTFNRTADLDPEDAILLLSLGWIAGVHGNLSDVQDFTEVEVLSCSVSQEVNLEQRDVLNALALGGPLGVRPDIAELTDHVIEVRLVTTTVQRFDLERATVLSALALSGPDGFDPTRVWELAIVDRHSNTERHYRQDVSLEEETALAALAATRPRGAP